MIDWVGILATFQARDISLWITEVWYEFSKSKVKNPPDFVPNAQIDYVIPNVMVPTTKIAWTEAPMGNFRIACIVDNSEDVPSLWVQQKFLPLGHRHERPYLPAPRPVITDTNFQRRRSETSYRNLGAGITVRDSLH